MLALRSVEFARRHDVPLHVRSSFLPEEGTWITKETPDMEKAIVSGIAHRSDEAKITVSGVADRPGVAARSSRPLADANLNVDTIIQNVGATGAAPTSRSPCRSTSCARRSTTLEALRGDARLPRARRATTRSARSRWSARA